MEDMVGFGFRPTDVELVGYYLCNKILGKNELVERAINEANICSFDPWELPSQSKIKSRDRVWYFFSPRENKYASGNRQSRRTISGSGFWKLTGEHVDVKDQWGTWCGNRGTIIGQKRVLGFHRGKSSSSSSKGIKSDWVIHEYHYTLLPENQRTYVICRLEYKGDNMNIISANATDPTPTFAANMTTSAGSVVDQSLQGSHNTFSEYDSANHGQWSAGDLNTHHSVQGNSGFFNNFSEYDSANQWFASDFNAQQQAPYLPPYGEDIWDYEIRENFDSLVDERTYMQENRSDHRPKKPVSGFLADDSSDSDTDSMICGDDSSSTDSVASSNGPYHTPRDDILSSSTIEPLQDYVAQEQPKQLKLQLQGNGKVIKTQRSECEWKMAEDLVKKAPSTTGVKQSWIVLEEMSQRKSQWNYLKNMIIGFLLFIFIIGWIILVG
uniref:NAC domain-containing protein 1 n=1 Tax=Noccaea caerulescens TaxID=107243 RepID=A0A1J3HMR0_NOCCA